MRTNLQCRKADRRLPGGAWGWGDGGAWGWGDGGEAAKGRVGSGDGDGFVGVTHTRQNALNGTHQIRTAYEMPLTP